MKRYTPLLLLMLAGCGKAPQGAQGPAGQTGAPGVDTSPISVVQLCTSCVPTYPSVFAEVAYCIDGSLYATYSANGGFTTEIPPGAYSSDGVGCSCSFTVEAGCIVMN